MIGAAGETVLPRRVQPQPTPDIVAGGDCGACVLGGALGIGVERVYDELKGGRESLQRGEMARCMRVAVSRGLADRTIEDAARWFEPHWQSFGQPGHLHALAWFNYVRMAIDAGYYGLALVDHARRGGTGAHPHFDVDHWVLIAGARVPVKPPDHQGGWLFRGEVLVSCSARSSGMQDEWVDAREFLQHRGGYDILFVRPAP